MADISKASLLAALSSMFGAGISDAEYTAETLRGGTVGEVCHIAGHAIGDCARYPFSLVLKTQRRWHRPGDPDSWRREYDIYKQGLTDLLPRALRLPRCWLLEEGDDVTRIWMAYIDGRSGSSHLHADELALAARRLGEMQAGFHLRGRRGLPYLRAYPAIRSSFDLWSNRMLPLLKLPMDGFPDELRKTLNDYAARSKPLLEQFKALPLTLCQGDVHHDNLIFSGSGEEAEIYLIDWDSAGYGFMGEDAVDVLMEAFVYSDRDVRLLPGFRQKIIGGYCQGAGSRGVGFEMSGQLIKDIFALAWGFRLADLFLYHKDELPKKRCVEILETMLHE